MTVATETPRIYVASLADYVNGTLHGTWIDLDGIDLDELYEQIKAMLTKSKLPLAEEWAIHDFEGFGSIRLGEYESFERVLVWAKGIAEHGEPYAAWVTDVLGKDYGSSASDYDPETFEQQFDGEYVSLADWAQEEFESAHGRDWLEETIGDLHYFVNWEDYGEHLSTDLTVIEAGSKVWIFDPNA